MFVLTTTTPVSGSYQSTIVMDSPIQIIAIQSPIGARTIPVRDGRTNKATKNDNTIGWDGRGEGSKIIVIKQQNQIQQQEKQQPEPYHQHHHQQQQADHHHVHQPNQHQQQQHRHQEFNRRRPQMLVSNQHSIRLHIAPGAYPVYYVIANANGRFMDHHIRTL